MRIFGCVVLARWCGLAAAAPVRERAAVLVLDLGPKVPAYLREDNPADVRVTQEALREGKVKNTLRVARDGEDAIVYLRTAPTRPDLILLDLNLPRKDGREVLREIKNDPKLKTIPVVVLTTSAAEADILKTYALHANCYITKPVDLDQFITVVKSIDEFWLSIVKLPPDQSS